MCGIAGFLDLERRAGTQELEALGRAMAAKLSHRGPDAEGVWADAEAGVLLGHTRLSIVDLSPAGAQPMISSCGACVISYNGEIYNAAELRRELETRGRRFKGHSDTEVIVEGVAEWGVEPTVKRLIGMFAFALWDRRTRTLSLVRDRLGIKPLYFGRHAGRVVFASELKAFDALPDFRPELDRDALLEFLRFAYVPTPMSIWRDIRKLEPGHIAVVEVGGCITTQAFWSLDEIVERGAASPLTLSDREACETLETLLADAVGRRLIADVPLGAFLSGGIDSSTVTAMMRLRSTAPVRTYSVGFSEAAYNEAPQARAVAKHLGTEHTELYVNPAEALEVIPKLPSIYDEPFADSSQIPTYLLSKLTRQHVTVALSGDGGDELFAGYTRHQFARVAANMPSQISSAIALGLGAAGPALWDRVSRLLPTDKRPRHVGDKMMKAAAMFRAEERGYASLVSAWETPEEILNGATASQGSHFRKPLAERLTDPLQRMQYLDTATYLPDDILTKVDRASMAVALEVRVPLLDHRIVEFVWKLPNRLKLRFGQGKWLLRQVLHRHVPRELVERPKTGFAVPVDRWLRGPLRPWAEELLSVESLTAGGLLNPAPIRARWSEHLEGHRNWVAPIWAVLMFQAWRAARGI
jgi:asparagine synthase (glutamine-hydrolysing)